MTTTFSKRFYNYSEYRNSSVTNWIVFICCLCFVFQHILGLWFRSSFIDYTFSLSGFSIVHGAFWAFITYAFLHGNFWHIFFNLLFFYFIGREIEKTIGSKKLFFLYLISTIAAGVFWFAFNFNKPAFLMGASGSVLGVFCYYCCMYPNQPMTFLFFFILPVTLKPKVLLLCIVAYELFSFIFAERAGVSSIANSAHLGGILGGGLCFILFNRIALIQINPLKRKNAPLPSLKCTVNISERDQIQADLDKILDKINEHGFGSLTDKEKEFLDKVKDVFKSRS